MKSEPNTMSTSTLIESRYGSLCVPGSPADLVGKFLIHYGEWAHFEAQFMSIVLPPKPRILDIGAYVGTFLLELQLAGNLGPSWAIEASPTLSELLASNLTRLAPGIAQSMYALVTPVEVMDVLPASYSLVQDDTPYAKCLSIEDAARTLGPFDLIKVDVDGQELDIIENAHHLLKDTCQVLWIQCDESTKTMALSRRLLATGRPLTYFAWPSHNELNFNGRSRAVLPMSFESGLLLGIETPKLPNPLLKAGCICASIETEQELRDQLWRTPRWPLDGWENFSKTELAGVASHLAAGLHYQTFVSESGSTPAYHGNLENRVLEFELDRMRQEITGDQVAKSHSQGTGTADAKQVRLEDPATAEILSLREHLREADIARARLEAELDGLRNTIQTLTEDRRTSKRGPYRWLRRSLAL